MSFIDSIKICFVKYVDFTGGASRPEFWWWVLFTVVASLALRSVSYNLPEHSRSHVSAEHRCGGAATARYGSKRLVGAAVFPSRDWLDHPHHFLGGAGQAESIRGA